MSRSSRRRHRAQAEKELRRSKTHLPKPGKAFAEPKAPAIVNSNVGLPNDDHGNAAATSPAKPVFIIICETLVIVVFGTLAGLFASAGLMIAGLCCGFVAIAAAFVVTSHLILNAKPKWKKPICVIGSLSLLAFLVWFSFWSYALWKPKPKRTNTPEAWQPPELPEDARTAQLYLGDLHWSVPLDKINDGKPFILPDVPTWMEASLPTVLLKDNRLYVRLHASLAGMKVLSSPYIFDETLPRGYERNYDANAFELVNEYAVPTCQVIYDRPNMITMNGIWLLRNPTNDTVPRGVLTIFGTNWALTVVTNRDEELRIIMPYKTNTLFRYPFSAHPRERVN